jgi:preprotein translocase subunit YajC
MNKRKILDTVVTTTGIIAMVIGMIKKDTPLVILASQLFIFIELLAIRKKIETEPEEKTGCGCKH